MKYALISPTEKTGQGLRIAEVVNNPFEVAAPLFFVECQNDVIAERFYYDPQAGIVEFVPSPIVPTRVEMAQARLALLQQGLLDDVEAAMSSMPRDAQIEWEFRSHVVRTSPLVTALATQLQLDEAQLDALFTLAASL